MKRNANRLREWKKEIRRELELELELVLERNKDTRREKKRKTIIYQKYVHAGDSKINKKKKKRRNKETYNNSWEIDKRDFSRIFIFILASNKTSKNIIVIETTTMIITITSLTLMKSSYPTYHNNQI